MAVGLRGLGWKQGGHFCRPRFLNLQTVRMHCLGWGSFTCKQVISLKNKNKMKQQKTTTQKHPLHELLICPIPLTLYISFIIFSEMCACPHAAASVLRPTEITGPRTPSNPSTGPDPPPEFEGLNLEPHEVHIDRVLRAAGVCGRGGNCAAALVLAWPPCPWLPR